MKKLIFALLLLTTSNLFAQKVKGVVTYMDDNAKTHTNMGESVYLIPCKNCSAKDFFYITNYTLEKSIIRGNEKLTRMGGNPDPSNVSTDTMEIYKNKIESLISKSITTATVDGAGNYSIETIKTGRYLLLFECSICDGYSCNIIEIKGKETLNKDHKFLCF